MAYMAFPATLYAVAISYRRDGVPALMSDAFCVSGTDPLEAEEVFARARREIKKRWPDKEAPFHEWKEELAVYRSITIGGANEPRPER